jgi:hypothetical protein
MQQPLERMNVRHRERRCATCGSLATGTNGRCAACGSCVCATCLDPRAAAAMDFNQAREQSARD